MKIRILFFAAALCVAATANETALELLPRGRPFRLTFADPREIRMALGFVGDNRIDAMVGNYFSLVGFRPKDNPDWEAHFGLEGAGYFTMAKAGARFPLETADGLIGLYFEGKQGPWQAQLRFTHISAHLADGYPEANAIPYSREFLTARVGYLIGESSHVYGGISWLVHTIPILPGISYQLGATTFLPWASAKIAPFIATDIRWGPALAKFSWSFQTGIGLNNPPESFRSFRFFYQFYDGADPRGQFYNRVVTMHSLGIEMQI